MDDLQYMPETVAVYLSGVERLRTFEQHFELLVRLVQVPGLFRNRIFKRAIEGV